MFASKPYAMVEYLEGKVLPGIAAVQGRAGCLPGKRTPISLISKA